MAENKKNALLSYERFIGIYRDQYPKAVNCLEKDKDRLFTFWHDYPAVHWTHIRTTNPIESTFSTFRHRSYRTKNCGNRVTTLTMVYKLVMESEKKWHKLKDYKRQKIQRWCFEGSSLECIFFWWMIFNQSTTFGNSS